MAHAAEAEACLHQALAVARRQQARVAGAAGRHEPGTAVAAAGQARPRPTQLLAPVYGWFTEGFDTADLQQAKALLQALA